MSQIEETFKGSEDAPYTFQEFRVMVAQRGFKRENHKNHLEREVEAIKRIMAGYVIISDEDIVSSIISFLPEFISLSFFNQVTAFGSSPPLSRSSLSCLTTATKLYQGSL